MCTIYEEKNRLRCTVDYKNRTSLLFITFEGIHKTTFGKNLIILSKRTFNVI